MKKKIYICIYTHIPVYEIEEIFASVVNSIDVRVQVTGPFCRYVLTVVCSETNRSVSLPSQLE